MTNKVMVEAIKNEYLRIRQIDDMIDRSRQWELFDIKICRVKAEGLISNDDIREINEYMANVRKGEVQKDMKKLAETFTNGGVGFKNNARFKYRMGRKIG